jgi:phospholipid/cholesterol/gamma-HCH transport system permease protein
MTKKGFSTLASFTLSVEATANQEVTASISGNITLENLNTVEAQLRKLFRPTIPAKLTVDLARLDYLDSAGALMLIETQAKAKARSIPFSFVNLSADTGKVLGLIDAEALRQPPLIKARRSEGFVEQVGGATLSVLDDLVQVITFLGDLIISLFSSLFHPRSVRWDEIIFYMKKAGVEGLPILGLISFLLGLILAFMTSLQLKQFGANIFVASLMAIAMTKELGPIMTAIIVAGRSGSAFAAEIGTMKVNEEVDALMVMGFDPVRFLAVPKVTAAIIVVPLLTLYSDFFGLLGGLVVGITGLDLTIYSYLHETQKSITIFDIVVSHIKSMVFAFLIAGIGCQRGFQVRGGAQAVGTATTSAVVAAIFLIIVADSAFALVVQYLG